MYPQINGEFLNTLEVVAEKIITFDGDVIFYQNLFTKSESNEIFLKLLDQISWKQDYFKVFGKSKPLPRLTAWYGEPNKIYTYSGIKMTPEAWNPTLLFIKKRIEILTEVKFNSVLLNLYRHGNDSVSWHSDDEPELGKNPIIGSVNFGETRQFILRHKYRKDSNPIQIDLTHGSFLLMKGETQHFWQHQIPKIKKLVKKRINLTFRVIH